MQGNLECISSSVSDKGLGTFWSLPVKLSVVTQQRQLESCQWHRMSPVYVPAVSVESSRSGPCLAVTSSEPDVTTGGGQDFTQDTSVLRSQVHVSHLTKHHSSHWAHLHPPNLSAPGLPPQPCSRALLEFKLNEFSTNALIFQKQPKNLCDPVRVDLHPLS